MYNGFSERLLYVIICLFLILGGLAMNDVLVYTPDSARYLVWAKSLAQFKGFEDLSIPEPFHYVVHAPLYAVLLVPAALLAPDNIVAAKILTLVMGSGLLLLFFLWMRGLSDSPAPTLGTAILAVHPLMLLFSHQILSEIPFAMALLGTLILVDRIVSEKGNSRRDELILACLLAGAALLREIGITLVFATAIFFGAHRNFRRALVLLLIPLAVYGIWFIRNEILVAGVEHPPLRNSEIFALHYFTPRSAPLLEEFLARFQINISVYAGHVARLMFLPQYGPAVYGVVVTTTPPYSWVASGYSFLSVVLAVVSLGTALVGLIASVRKHAAVELLIAFVPIYLFLILLYPFNDVRFLFPLLLFMIAFSVIGSVEILRSLSASQSKAILAGSFGLAMIPNLVWTFAYVRDAIAYRSSPEHFYEWIRQERPFPDLLTKPMSRVGEWISAQDPDPVTVLTQWKELTFSLPNGKLAEVNTLVPLDEFERHIRDYSVDYIVSAVGLADIPEFFPQMELSTAYGFESAFRIANLEVFRVLRRRQEREDRREDLRGRFALGLRALDEGQADSAAAVFHSLAESTRGGSTIMLFLAIAHEFRGDLQRARELLAPLQIMKQSGAFLGHATYHLEIIDLLEQAKNEENATARAELLYVASVKYWNLGFHNQSLVMLAQSLVSDPHFPPALIFGAYYNLELGRRVEARRHFKRLAESVPVHPLVPPLQNILAFGDSIARSPVVRTDYYLGLASAYEDAGLSDSAIRELLTLSEHQPGNLDALKSLTRLYVSKRRYHPALRMVDQWLMVDPLDKGAASIRQSLMERW